MPLSRQTRASTPELYQSAQVCAARRGACHGQGTEDVEDCAVLHIVRPHLPPRGADGARASCDGEEGAGGPGWLSVVARLGTFCYLFVLKCFKR